MWPRRRRGRGCDGQGGAGEVRPSLLPTAPVLRVRPRTGTCWAGALSGSGVPGLGAGLSPGVGVGVAWPVQPSGLVSPPPPLHCAQKPGPLTRPLCPPQGPGPSRCRGRGQRAPALSCPPPWGRGVPGSLLAQSPRPTAQVKPPGDPRRPRGQPAEGGLGHPGHPKPRCSGEGQGG